MERDKCQVLLDAKTQDPEWVMRVWTPAPWPSLSFQRWWNALSVFWFEWVQQHRKSKPVPCSASLQSLQLHCTSYLPLSFSFPLQLCTAAANPSRCHGPIPGELLLPPAPGCLCARGQRGQVSTSRHGNLACHSLVTSLGEGRAMCAVPAGNLPGISQRDWLLGAVILGNRLYPFFFQRANTQLWNHLADLT